MKLPPIILLLAGSLAIIINHALAQDSSVATGAAHSTSTSTAGEASPSSSAECAWTGHCIGDSCETYNDCSGSLICKNGVCTEGAAEPTAAGTQLSASRSTDSSHGASGSMTAETSYGGGEETSTTRKGSGSTTPASETRSSKASPTASASQTSSGQSSSTTDSFTQGAPTTNPGARNREWASELVLGVMIAAAAVVIG